MKFKREAENTLLCNVLKNKNGFIVSISFYSSPLNDHGVAYAASDQMFSSMGYELKKHNVTVVSLYPGIVGTESVLMGKEFLDLANAESPEFVGRTVAALAKDESLHDKSGGILKTYQWAVEYGFTDIDGKVPSPCDIDSSLICHA
ncbi:hypothetical protein OAE97_03230 [Verrucomicrobia bacterium]|nr:hypothetical protein [Verrucomicrobiota bacterium]MDB4665338.1 hypothetical protein [Verrucomicrobiota bacterium]MDG1889699.1 hypothetical protein [Verrucomicrobiota bacterium]